MQALQLGDRDPDQRARRTWQLLPHPAEHAGRRGEHRLDHHHFRRRGHLGTFSSSIDVFYDIRFGSLSGAIIASGDQILTSSGTPWANTPPPGAVTINGVNQFLSGVNGDRSQDFWPVGPFTETGPGGLQHVVTTASVPEPSSLILIATGLVVAVGHSAHRRRSRTRMMPIETRLPAEGPG